MKRIINWIIDALKRIRRRERRRYVMEVINRRRGLRLEWSENPDAVFKQVEREIYGDNLE